MKQVQINLYGAFVNKNINYKKIDLLQSFLSSLKL